MAKNGIKSGGMRFARGALYTLLRNPICIGGEIRHNGTQYPGQHQPIVDRIIWDKTQELLRSRAARADGQPSRSMSSPLAGKLFDESGGRLTPSHALKGKRRYRYYVSRRLMTDSAKRSREGWRVPAAEIERSVATAAAMILDDRTAILADIEQSHSDASQVKSILDAASAWSNRLRSETEAPVALDLYWTVSSYDPMASNCPSSCPPGLPRDWLVARRLPSNSPG